MFNCKTASALSMQPADSSQSLYNFQTYPSTAFGTAAAEVSDKFSNAVAEQHLGEQFGVDKSMLNPGSSCVSGDNLSLASTGDAHIKNLLGDGFVCQKPIGGEYYGCWPSSDVVPRGKQGAGNPNFHRYMTHCTTQCHPLTGQGTASTVVADDQLCVAAAADIQPDKLKDAMYNLNSYMSHFAPVLPLKQGGATTGLHLYGGGLYNNDPRSVAALVDQSKLAKIQAQGESQTLLPSDDANVHQLANPPTGWEDPSDIAW